jgi:hypothetical protein
MQANGCFQGTDIYGTVVTEICIFTETVYLKKFTSGGGRGGRAGGETK